MFKIQVLVWDRHNNVVGLNRLMASQFSHVVSITCKLHISMLFFKTTGRHDIAEILLIVALNTITYPP
jgi:hypothetical protein